jgi:hypothetical protein
MPRPSLYYDPSVMTPSVHIPNADSSLFPRTTEARIWRKHAEAALPKFNPERVLHQRSVATANVATLRLRTMILSLFTGVCCFEYKIACKQRGDLRWLRKRAGQGRNRLRPDHLRQAHEGAEISATPRGACCPVSSIDTPVARNNGLHK